MNRITTHPGEIPRDEFMEPFGLSANALARALDVPPNRMKSIIAADNPRSVTPDPALRLARYFGATPGFWLNLQQAYELSRAMMEQGARINDSVRPRAAGRSDDRLRQTRPATITLYAGGDWASASRVSIGRWSLSLASISASVSAVTCRLATSP